MKYNSVDSVMDALNEIFRANGMPRVSIEAKYGFDFFINKLHRSVTHIDRMSFYSDMVNQPDGNEVQKIRRFLKMYMQTFNFSWKALKAEYHLDFTTMNAFLDSGIVRSDRTWERVQQIYAFWKKDYQEKRKQLELFAGE